MTRSFIIAILGLLVLSDLPAAVDPIKDLTVSRIVVLEVNATINPAVTNYLETEVKRPELKDTLIVLKLNTPGGLVSTTKDILTLIGEADTPIVVWVTPEGASATSAGAIIASGAHGLVMNRGTNIGAATPVEMGADIKAGDLRAKALNDLTALVRALSQSRGRNAEAFEEMVSKATSYTADEAVKHNVADGIVTSLDQLRQSYDQRVILIKGQKRLIKFSPVIETEVRPMDLGQRLLNTLAHPTTAYILFVLGAALLYFEFQAPGGYLAGSIGVLSLLCAGIAFQVLPLNFGAAILLLVGVTLLILEIYITSYGLLALSGLACLVLGSLFLYRHDDGWLSVNSMIIFSTLAGITLFLGIVGWYLARHRTNQQAFFDHSGEEAEIIQEFGQEHDGWHYQVRVHGETWKARAAQELKRGERVRIKKQHADSLLLDIFKV